MLERTLGSLDYSDYSIWVGVYPNDPECQSVVRSVMERDDRVRIAVSPRAGPTTKADCPEPDTGSGCSSTRSDAGDFYELFVLHDAEDIVPSDELRQVNRGVSLVRHGAVSGFPASHASVAAHAWRLLR